MRDVPTIYVLAGQNGSGKTTLARDGKHPRRGRCLGTPAVGNGEGFVLNFSRKDAEAQRGILSVAGLEAVFPLRLCASARVFFRLLVYAVFDPNLYAELQSIYD